MYHCKVGCKVSQLGEAWKELERSVRDRENKIKQISQLGDQFNSSFSEMCKWIDEKVRNYLVYVLTDRPFKFQ